MSDRKAKANVASTARNPLLAAWKTPFELPPFEKIKPAHFRPAIDKAIETHKAEVEKILSSAASPTFANTIAAMEKAGTMLTRVLRVFYNLTSADTNPDLQAIERDIAPILSQHHTSIALDPRFFTRVDTIFQRGLRQKLDAEQRRVLERTHSGLVRAGARLDAQAKKRMAEINARLATLGTTFSQNVLADEQSYKLVLESEADLAGLPDFVRAAAKRAGDDLGFSVWTASQINKTFYNAEVIDMDAVAASSAIPLMFRPYPLEGEFYVDGGVSSGTHADLVLGSDHSLDLVLILAPMAAEIQRKRAMFHEKMFDRVGRRSLDEEIALIKSAWPECDVVALSPSPSVQNAMRPNPMDASSAVATFMRTLISMKRTLAHPEVWERLDHHLVNVRAKRVVSSR